MNRPLVALLFTCLMSPAAAADDPALVMTPLRGPVYLVEDDHYLTTNSLVYIGVDHVTVIGATWTPDTAALLDGEIRKVTALPITEVINISPDPEWAGGNAYWVSAGAAIHAASVTCRQLSEKWQETVAFFRTFRPSYPALPLVLPTHCHDGDFQLQDGAIQTLFLGGSHTPGDIFVYFHHEKILDAGSILKEKLGNMAGADVAHYPQTLQRLKKLDLEIELIVSGHYAPIHGPELIDHYQQLLARYLVTSSPAQHDPHERAN